MATKYTQEELLAMEQKEISPHSKIFCPRCGMELIYRERGNSCQVKCQTENCLEMNVRGI